jgi:hypothetical protein
MRKESLLWGSTGRESFLSKPPESRKRRATKIATRNPTVVSPSI